MKCIEWLSARWEKAGIKNADTVLLHSNVIRTLGILKKEGFKPSVLDILDSLLYLLGSNGTLVLPTFNFGFTKGDSFDINKTPSKMGSLTEVARLHERSIRTGHPIYSFAVIGKLSGTFFGYR